MSETKARTVPLSSLAKTIRSKNAGVDKITFDVIFPDRQSYDRVRRSGVLSREAICRLYRIDPERQLRRRRHFRQPAIRAATRHRGAD